MGESPGTYEYFQALRTPYLAFMVYIKHRAGKLNANADALSRNPCEVLKSSCPVDELSVDVCFECPNVCVS